MDLIPLRFDYIRNFNRYLYYGQTIYSPGIIVLVCMDCSLEVHTLKKDIRSTELISKPDKG